MCRFPVLMILLVIGAATPTWSQQAQPSQATNGAVEATSGQAGTAETVGQAGNDSQVPGQAGTPLQTGNPNNFATTNLDGFNGNPWFSDPGAQQQLQMKPTQKQQLLGAYQKAWQQYQRRLNRIPANITEAQRQERLQALQSRFYETYNRALDSTISNRQLRQRYNQLNRQYQGFGAFNDPQLQQGLNLTPAQRQQLSQMGNQWNQQIELMRQQFAADPTAVNQQFAQLQSQARQQMGTVLTPQQQQIWSQGTGTNYDFPWAAYNNAAGVGSRGAAGAAPGQGIPASGNAPAATSPATGGAGAAGGGTATGGAAGTSGGG